MLRHLRSLVPAAAAIVVVGSSFVVPGPGAAAAELFSVANGAWTAASTWSTACAGAPGAGPPGSPDRLHLCPGVTVSVPCGASVHYASLVDEPGDWSVGGGLVADGSACPRGQVPELVPSGAEGHVLDDMTSAASLVLRGRTVVVGAPFGEALDLDAGVCDAAHGVLFTNGTCARYSWANAPWSAGQPAVARLRPGDIVWFTSGQWRNNFVTVLSTTATTVTIAYGDPNDQKGAAGLGPAARAVASVTWDTSDPLRIEARVPAGAIAGRGQHLGACLVMQASHALYRIASSRAEAPLHDSLVFDPGTTVAAADLAGGAAWIAPCIRPGDRFDAFEPLVVRPATPGSDVVGFALLNGVCPRLEGVLLPNASGMDSSPAGDGPGFNVFSYAHTVGCAVEGPVAVGPLRDRGAQPSGYGVGLWQTSGVTLRRHSFQGLYFTSGVFHGFKPVDSDDLVIEDANVSYVNNEAFWPDSSASDPPGSPFEGVRATLRRFSAHDVFQIAGEADLAGGIEMINSNGRGVHSLVVEDALLWNDEQSIAIQLGPDPASHALVYDSVVAYPHVVAEGSLPSFLDLKIGAQCAVDPADAPVVLSNDAFLMNDPPAGSSSIHTLACPNLSYSYFAPAGNAVFFNATKGSENASLVGLLIEGGGPSAPTYTGIRLRRNPSPSPSTLLLRDLVLRDFCYAVGSPSLRGIDETGTGASPALLDVSHLTLGVWCPAATTSLLGPDSAGVRLAQGLDGLLAGSQLRDVLALVGDPRLPGIQYDMTPIQVTPTPPVGGAPLGIDRVLCSDCPPGGGPCSHACVAGADSARYALGGLLLDLASLPDPITAMGIVSATDLHLVPQSLPFLAAAPGDHMGARYAGVVRLSRAMQDFGLAASSLRYQAVVDDEPDPMLVPPEVASPDADGDGVPDVVDDCPQIADPAQDDTDGDGLGDACDDCVLRANGDGSDLDFDGIGDVCDDTCVGPTTTIITVLPRDVPRNGTIVITGNGFSEQATVLVGGISAPATAVGGVLYATVPSSLAVGSTNLVEVVNPEGCRSQEPALVTVIAPPACGLLGVEPLLALAAIAGRRRLRS